MTTAPASRARDSRGLAAERWALPLALLLALLPAPSGCDGRCGRSPARGRAGAQSLDSGFASSGRASTDRGSSARRDGASARCGAARRPTDGGCAARRAAGPDTRPADAPELLPAGELGVLPGALPPIPAPSAAALDAARPPPFGADPPQPETAEAPLAPRVVVRGRVTDWRTGAPLARFSVDPLDGTAAARPRRSDGNFVVRLAPGRRRLLVRAEGHVPTTIALEVADPRQRPTPALRIELRPAGSLRGSLQDSRGGAIADATVRLGPSAETTTDARGGFGLDDLPEGIYALEVRLRGRRVLREHGVAIRAGQTTGPLRLQLAPEVERGGGRGGDQ